MRRAVLPLLAAALLASGFNIIPAGATAPATCAPAKHAGGEWPIMGGDLVGSRNQTHEHTIGTLEAATLAPAWTFDANAASGTANNEITSYPIVADGCVYVGSSTGYRKPGWVFAMNADTGALVWKQHLPGGVYATMAVEGNRAFAYVSEVGHPTLYAFDAQTGRELWHTAADHQGGSDAVGSPVAYDGMVTVGISGTSAEGTDSQRAFIGSNVFIDAATGRILAKGYTIPEAAHKKGYAGGSIWSTMAIDPKTRYGYIGTGNPFSAEEYKTTNAIVKIDLHRDRPTFGQIVGSYKGNADHYFGELKAVEGNPACQAGLPATFEHPECLEVDLDFGAQPNIFRDSKGRLLVGDGQKSGVYHVADARTMKPVWTQEVGIFSAVGGIVGSAAFDGDRLYGPHTIGGYLWSLGKDDGSVQWVSPTADAVHWAEPVALANGILYTVDLKGFLDGYDAATGAPILHRPMGIGASTGADPTFSWGGTTVARHRVYASVGVGASSAGDYFPSMPNGFVIAFAPEA